ncbi:MAG: hypothetical protein JXR25_14755 [Pontiellaceae bacterium]|nr:hypothetical protein [Pontiellaceae bacterium]MBN2786080.1 hypothetical protein [Pontiellaceae bacterium]
MIDRQIMGAASAARKYLDAVSRRHVVGFISRCWNPDGGVRGRDSKSDLYYTFFATLSMVALRGRIPWFRLYRYLRTFGDGSSLDAAHFFCLLRLRLIFPCTAGMRRRFAGMLESKAAETPYDLFFKVSASQLILHNDEPEANLLISDSQTTPNLAASVMINDRPDPVAEAILMKRFCPQGGFAASNNVPHADLLSTATALMALRNLNIDLSGIRAACFDFIESQWRDSGGFAGYPGDAFEDVEYTFYALLSIGCLMK